MTDLPTYRQAVERLNRWIDRHAPNSSHWSDVRSDRDSGGREWLEQLDEHQFPEPGDIGHEAEMVPVDYAYAAPSLLRALANARNVLVSLMPAVEDRDGGRDTIDRAVAAIDRATDKATAEESSHV